MTSPKSQGIIRKGSGDAISSSKCNTKRIKAPTPGG